MSDHSPDSMSPEIYHNNADPERDSAKRLADSLEPWRYSVPAGPILEIGAGTGIFTPHIRRILPSRKIEVTDRSEAMLKAAQSHLADDSDDHMSFSTFDAANDAVTQRTYALICSNHVAHQFEQPAQTLEKLALGLKIDGLMLMGFPGEDSFKEWRSVCVDLGLPYTGREMPGTEPLVIHLSMGPVQVDFYEDQSVWYFDDFRSFLSHMENGGRDIEKDDRKLSSDEIDLIEKNWKKTKDGKLGITFHNVFLALKRIGE